MADMITILDDINMIVLIMLVIVMIIFDEYDDFYAEQNV